MVRAMTRIGLRLAGALTVAVLTALAIAGPAAAASHNASDGEATTRSLGGSGAWSAYASSDKTGRVCYLAGEPRKSEPARVTRRQPMAMVTHRPAENIANVVSFVEGYALRAGSDVTLEIGDRKFKLFTQGDSAWAPTSELDRMIVATLARGGSAAVNGEPENGQTTTDIYSLAGFAKTLALIDKACGISRERPGAPPPHAVEHRRHKPQKGKPHQLRKPYVPPNTSG
jgi:Invasion associated locus B (IalB) protein